MNHITKSILLAGMGLVLSAPLSAASPSFPEKDVRIHTWTISNWKLEGLKVESRGTIKFTEDYKDVTSISEGGYLKISMTSFGMRRKLIIQPEGDRLIYSFYEGRREVAFEPQGRKWMEEVLPSVVRSTGLDAEERVNRIYKKEGIQGFLKELESTSNDYNQANLIKYLLSNHDLKNEELQELVRVFPYQISSDYELSRLMKQYNSLFLRTPELSKDFFRGIEEISSDYETSQVLKQVYQDNELDDATFESYIMAMEGISSDYEKSNLLKMAIRNRKLTQKQMEKLLGEIDDVSSDYEKSNIIKALIRNEDFSPETMNQLLELSKNISSDYEKSQVINDLLRNQLVENSNLHQFTELLEDISSDYTYREILKDIMEYEKLGKGRFDYLLKASERISSSYELSQFYKSLLEIDELSKQQQLRLIELAEGISSSYELSNFLIQATQTLDMDDEEIRQALTNAAGNISSEYEYGRVMKAIMSKSRAKDH